MRCRPEIQARHTAFKRGSAYLERYCLLIAFTAYLEAARRTGADMTFEEWMAARPDVGQARDSILENPAGETRQKCASMYSYRYAWASPLCNLMLHQNPNIMAHDSRAA
jgi:hypothetical protein